jgi:transposase
MPHLSGLSIEDVGPGSDGVVVIDAAIAASAAVCPYCGGESMRVHSRYWRRLADAAVAGRAVQLRLRVRRFFCDNTGCAARTFVEQVSGLTVKWARRTRLAAGMLTAIALALAGRAAARLAARLAVPASRSTLLRLVRRLPDPAPAALTRIGVDDFAFRRGHTYGTVIIDIDSHRPVDVLADRTRDTLADWLRAHPGIELVCRDRAGAYAEAVRTAAPNAVQVADRWHLWHNLCEAVEKTVIAERAALRPLEPEPHEPEPAANKVAAVPDSEPVVAPAELGGRLATRTRQRWTAVHDLLAAGRSISAIARELHLQRKTVRRFARATTVEELLERPHQRRSSLLDPYKPYLAERLAAGCVDAVRLTGEIGELGYRGSRKTVRTWLHPLRGRVAPKPVSIAPTVRQVTGWLTRHPDRLTEDERLHLKQVLVRSPMLTAAHRQVGEFAVILTTGRGDHLDAWLHDIDTTGAAALRGFARGLRTDLAAVTAGLTLPFSSGPVEGNVCRIKALKRQMYGRAGFDLLRKRILHPA